MSALIVILIDGLGSEYVTQNWQRLPNISSLAGKGCTVARLGSQRCATSMPGRASLLTGVASSQHGIYGNVIWDGHGFRHANASDIRTTTVVEQAATAGLEVACIGYGMVDPKYCSHFHAPFWADEMMHNSQAAAEADSVWQQAIAATPGNLQIPSMLQRVSLEGVARRENGQDCDGQLLQVCAELALGAQVPDLIITEIASPDYFLHAYGYDSPEAVAAIDVADAQVGELINRLQREQQLNKVNIVITSDHGFAPIDQSIHADVIFPGALLSCEGGVLHIALAENLSQEYCAEVLADYGVQPLCNRYLPGEQRVPIASFLAPPGWDFFPDYQRLGEPVGRSKYRASHGFAPGQLSDEKFVVAAGPDIPPWHIDFAEDEQLAPTLASLLDLAVKDYPLAPIF